MAVFVQIPLDKRITYTILIVWLVHQASSANESGCDPARVAACTGDLRKLSSHPMDEVAEDVAGLEQQCREMEETKQCLLRETSQCSEAVRSIYLSYMRPVTASFQDLCRPGKTRDEYLEHAPCFGRMSRRDGPCSAKYEKLRKLITSDQDLSQKDNNTLQQFCCYFYAVYNCYRSETEKQCGPEAYRIFERYSGYLSSSVLTVSCEKQTNNTECEPVAFGTHSEKAATAGDDSANAASSALSVLILLYIPLPFAARRLWAAL